MELSSLSKYRAQLMGIATIFITLCHTSFAFNGVLSQLDGLMIYLTKSGVDIFLLLSGLGCYFSYAKQPKYLAFQEKRFVRIMLPYLLVIIPVIVLEILFEGKSLLSAVFTESIFSFYTNGYLNLWYISAILLLSILFPFVYYLVNKKFIYTVIVCFVIAIIVFAPFWEYAPLGFKEVNSIFFSRVPTFILGAYIGKIIFQNNSQANTKSIEIHKYLIITVFIISTLLLVGIKVGNELWNTYFDLRVVSLLFLPFSLSFSIVISHCLSKIDNSSVINRTLVFFGSISLTMFLIFIRVLHFTRVFLVLYKPEIEYNLLVSITVNVSSIVLSILLSVFIQKISDKLSIIILNRNNRAVDKKH